MSSVPIISIAKTDKHLCGTDVGLPVNKRDRRTLVVIGLIDNELNFRPGLRARAQTCFTSTRFYLFSNKEMSRLLMDPVSLEKRQNVGSDIFNR